MKLLRLNEEKKYWLQGRITIESLFSHHTHTYRDTHIQGDIKQPRVMQVDESTEGVIYVSVYTTVNTVYTLLEALLAQVWLQRLRQEAAALVLVGGSS